MKIVGYVLSVLGLIVIALSNQIAKLSFLTNMPKSLIYILLTGIILILVGIAVIMGFSKSSSSSGNIKHATEEVPIYEGVGKKRVIVGYRKESKK